MNKGLSINIRSEYLKHYMCSTNNTCVRRAFSHCPAWKDAHKEQEHLTQILISNRYTNIDVSDVRRHMDKWYARLDTTTIALHEHIKIYYKTHMSTRNKAWKKLSRTSRTRMYDPQTWNNASPSSSTTKQEKHHAFYFTTDTPLPIHLFRRTMSFASIPATVKSEDHSYIGMTQIKVTRHLTCHLLNRDIKNHFTTLHNSCFTRQNMEENTKVVDREQDPRHFVYL